MPPLDLPDLLPFFENCLALNRRRPKSDGLALSFKTPDEWLITHAIKKSYGALVFDRKSRVGEGELMGVGHPLMEMALHQSERLLGSFCVVGGLESPLLVVEVSSRVTDSSLPGGRVIASVTGDSGRFLIQRDWELLRLIQGLALRSEPLAITAPELSATEWSDLAMQHVEARLADLRLPFGSPQVKRLAVFWPN